MGKASQKGPPLGVVQVPTGPLKKLGESANRVVCRVCRPGNPLFPEYGRGQHTTGSTSL